MKRDIKKRADIEMLVNVFYERVNKDRILGPVFNEVANINWEKHLPVFYDFWDNVVFYSGTYEGNPVRLHTKLYKLTSLEKKHFTRWLDIFSAVIDEFYEGEKAELMKEKGRSMAKIIREQLAKNDRFKRTI